MLKNLIKRIVHPHTYSSEAFIKHLRSLGATIGEDVHIYAPDRTSVDMNSAQFVEIGDRVQIAAGVKILAHDYSFSVLANVYHTLPRKQSKTVIGNGVLLGMDTIVLMGAEIGDNVIVGAGSVVSGKLESNSVYAGNPVRKICTLEHFNNKNKERFIASAQCYAEGFKKKHGRFPKPNEMISYYALFTDRDGLVDYAMNENFYCISKEAKQNLSMPEFEHKFKTVEELMDYKG